MFTVDSQPHVSIDSHLWDKILTLKITSLLSINKQNINPSCVEHQNIITILLSACLLSYESTDFFII